MEVGWALELVQTGSSDAWARFRVAELDEVAVLSDVNEIRLDLAMSQRLLGKLQQAFVAIREAALRTKAVQMCAGGPALRLKDYRRRSLQTLFGTVGFRVPRLTCVAPGRKPPVVLTGSSRSPLEHERLRARLGAWMSYRAVANLIAEMFALASGRHASTVQQQVRRWADRLATTSVGRGAADLDAAASIDLGPDTTFIRSCAADGPRHHEVLIGVGVNDRGHEVKIGGVIAAVEQPHRLIDDALRSLARGSKIGITPFTDGDRMLRQLLKKAGIKVRPILDWQHIARRV